MNRTLLISRAHEVSWFHAIDFGDFVSPGRFPPDTPPNRTLIPTLHFLKDLRLAGSTCLDVGTADGLVAFSLKQLGAANVVACDRRPMNGFEIARQLVKLDVKYHVPVRDLASYDGFPTTSFDVIVMTAFPNHVLSPIATIAACRRLIKPGGILITEAFYVGGAESKLVLNTECDPPLLEHLNTYLIPTKSAMEGMLKLACFDPVATGATSRRLVREGQVARITHVSRAVRPSELSARVPQLGRVHTDPRGSAEIDFRHYENEVTSEPSPFVGRPGHHEFSAAEEMPWAPLQPSRARMRSISSSI